MASVAYTVLTNNHTHYSMFGSWESQGKTHMYMWRKYKTPLRQYQYQYYDQTREPEAVGQ